MLFTVSSVCAVDSEIQAISAQNSTDTVASTVNDDNLGMNDANEILAETDDFTALNEEINGDSSKNYVELNKNYHGSNSYNNGKGIQINRENVVIDGKGHTIDCTGETSRMFNIIVDGITLKNINFIGGSFTHGGAIYTNKYLTIINCTFKDNQATGASSNAYGGGAIYASGAGNISVLNSTFINNHAAKNGGAIDINATSDVDSKIDHCVFISNTADNLAGLLFTTNKGTVNITNSIIINNTCNSGYTANDIIYAGTTVYVDNNWWGSTVNNRSDYPVYIAGNVVPNNWYYLDLNVNSILDQADISLNNLYMYDGSSASIVEDNHYNLPNVTLNISAINANVVNNVSLDKYGKSTISYTTTAESGYLGVSYHTTEITKPISESGNTFTDLQNVINCYKKGSTVILKKDYVFDSTTDSSLTGGVEIPYSMTIDGQGHSIDAKGQGRIFLVFLDGLHDITYKNITFLNGKYSQRGGAIYSAPDGGDGSIINCTFINNQVTGNSFGGAVSIYAGIKNIINSTFIDCSAPYGGAIQSQFDPCNVLNCTFIDNKATYYSDYGGAIYLESGIISDSIFINNPDVPIYSYGTVTANNNWFGNTIDNFDVAPAIDSVTVDNWYVLDLDIDHNGVATVSLNNLYENGILDKSNTYYNLPPITVNVKGTNVDIDENVTLDKTGKATIAFTPTDSYSITVTYKNIKLTKEMKPSFTYLNSLINNLQTQTLDLEDDFEYYSDSDSALSGGILLDENIIIDGHGHYIDAKGESCIFNVNDDSKNLVLKNIRFSNAKGLNGTVVYFKGNKIEIINCTFENNSAENEGDAVYIAGINEASSIEKCAFINNKGTNSVIYIGSDNVQFDIKNSIFLNNTDLNIKGSANVVAAYNWFGHNASNYDDNSIANVDGRITLTNYLFLNVSYTSDIITISLNNLYDGNVGSYDDCSVPSVKLNVKNENLTVGNNAIIAENGKCELDYAINALTGSLTAYYEDISYTKDIAFIDDGSFSALQLIINTAQGNIINLERNYTYNPNKDSALVTGITFTKPMTIIGNGNVKIDAKDMARIFNVNQDITFRNISFVNGNVLSLSSQRGAAIYNNGGNCRFINCSFINNTAYQGGAIYNSQNTLNQFENCTFINNTATSQGGVINNYQGFAKFIDSIFVNNSATGSGGVYFTEFYGYDYYDNCTFINNSAKMSAVINSGTTGTTYDKKIINSTFIGNRIIDGPDATTNTIIFSYVTAVEGCIFNDNTAASIIYAGFSNFVVKNSIFLNNTANYVITGSYPSSIAADYNWFGNNVTNYNVRPNLPTNLVLNNWYVLNITANKFNAIISLNNLYDGSDVQKDYADYALPNITLDIKSINLNVQNNVTLNKTGKTQIPFTLTSDRGLLSLTKGSTIMSKEIKLGDFDLLQQLVNENDVVELTRDYAYDLDFDIITEGVIINKPNLIINGNGFTIDAKGKSRILKITESGVTINNVTLINGKADGEGGAIYCSGDDCTITSSIFVNNTATSGSAVYLTGSNGKINDCIFVNNQGDNDINAPNDLNADYNWFGNNASNYNTNIAKIEGFNLNNWYFLNMTLAQSSANIDLNNVYVVSDQSNVTNDNCALPNVNFTLTGENVTVQNDIVINQKGNVPITPLYKDLSLTASFETASYTVNKTLQGDFAILQQLINDAGADGIVNLDRNYTYIVGADTITAGIDIFYRNVTINGNGFTINALGKSSIFKVGSNAHNLTINNVTFINAGGSSGGAIYWNSAKNGNIINSRFINNTYSNGGGAIYFSGGNINIINSTFKDNSAPQNGGAFYLFNGASVLINNSTFINNTAQNGGVIYVYSGSMSINKSDFINNTVRATGSTKVYGGVIYCQSTFSDEIDIMNSNFINNGAKSFKGNCYGGVIYVASGIMNIANSTFNRNYITSTSATTYGTVFYWSNAKGEIINSSFLNNHGKSSFAAVIYGTGTNSKLNVTNSIFLNNTYESYNTLKVMHRYSSGTFNFTDCWFGNIPENSGSYMGITQGTGVTVNNRLTLSSDHEEYMVVGEDRNVRFVFEYVIGVKKFIYDASKLPKINLTLSSVNGRINKNSASMDEDIAFNATEFGQDIASITAKYNGIEYTELLSAKAQAVITVEPITVHVGETVSVNVIEKLPQDADLHYWCAGDTQEDEFILVYANGAVEGKSDGTTTLYVKYNGNDDYAPETVEVPVTVIKYNTELVTLIDSNPVDSIVVDWGGEPQSIQVGILSDDPDPDYTGVSFNFKSNDTNVAKFSRNPNLITFGAAGTANITFFTAGNERYYGSEKNITVTVRKVPSSIELSKSDLEFAYGGSDSTALTLVGGSVDYVNISVEGHPEAVIVFENNVITVSGLDVGTYALKVTSTPDENHTSVTETAYITVTKVDSSVEFENNVEFDYLGTGTTKLINFVGCSVDLVNITVEGQTGATVSYDDATKVITVSGLDAGTYTLKVSTTPDGNHNSVDVTADITVNKIDSSVTFGDIEFDYLGSGNTTITDYDGCSVELENITVVDNPQAVIGFENDVVTVSGLGAGIYTLKVTTTPDSNHKSVVKTKGITVNKIPSQITLNNTDIVYKYDESNTTNLTLVGCSVDLVNITVDGNNVAGVTYDAQTKVITVSGIDVGTHTLKVTTTPDENHTSVDKTAAITVEKSNSSVSFSNPVELFFSESGTSTLTLNGCTVDLVNITVLDHPEAVISYENNVITVSNLNIGTYTLKVITTPDSNHLSVVNTTSVTVYKESPKLEMEYSNITVGERELVYVSMNITGQVNITISKDGSVIRTENVTIGSSKFNKTAFTGLNVGTYTITAHYEGQGRYNSSTLTYELVIRPIYEYEFSASVNDTVMGNKTNVTVNLPEGASGNIVIGEIEQKVEGTKTVIELPEQKILGKNNVTVKYVPDEDSKYASRELTVLYEISKVDTSIALSVVNKTTADPVIITAAITAEGNVTFVVNGKKYSKEIISNVATLELTDVAGGEYNVTAIYDGSEKYGNSTANETYTVEKINSTISIDVDPTTIRTDEGATVTVNVQGSGIVTITVNGIKTNVTVDSGVATLPIEKLAKGTTTITAKYLGDDKYNTNETEEITLTVNPIALVGFDIDIVDITVGDDAIAYVIVPSDAANMTNVTVKQGDVVLFSENTTFKLIIPDLAVGTYSITAHYYGDDKYDVAEISKEFTVNPLNMGKLNFTAAVNSTIVGEKTNVTVKISEDATGKIVIGDIERDISESEFVIELPAQTTAGLNNITVQYIPDENSKYGLENITAFYNVAKRSVEITIEDITGKKAGDDVEIVASAYEGALITVYVDGVKTETVENVSAGKHTIIATVEETDEYLAATANKTFEVTKSDVGTVALLTDSYVYVGEKLTINVNIINVYNDVAGIVEINVNGTKYSLNIPESKLEVVMNKAGNIVLSGRYLGDYKYDAKDASVDDKDVSITQRIIEVREKATPEITIEVDHLSVVGQAMTINVSDLENLTVTINGIEQSVNDGKISFTPAKDGAYTIIAKTTENKTHYAGESIASFTVINKTKQTPEISVSEIGDAKVGSEITFTVDASVGEGVIVKIDDEIIPLKDGAYTYTPKTSGSHIVYVETKENGQYSKGIKTQTFNVDKNDATIKVSADPVKVGETATIEVEVTPGATGLVIINVNGTEYSIKLPQTTLDVVLDDVGSYSIFASYLGDNNFTENASDVISLEVSQKAVSNFTVEIPDDIKVAEPFTINVTSESGADLEVYLDGVKQTLADGKVNVDTLSAGTHTIQVISPETSTHMANSTTQTFTVSKKQAQIKIDVGSDLIVDKNIKLILESYPGAELVVYIDGKALDNWETPFKTTAGNHLIIATVADNDEYLGVTVNKTFTVAKKGSSVHVSGDHAIVGEKSIIEVDLTNDATGIVIVNVNGTEYSLNITENKSLSIVLDKAGTYNISAKYLGDDKYLPSESEVNTIFAYDKKASVIDIDYPEVIYAGDDIKITITSDNGEFEVYLDGEKQTLSEGILTIENIASGTHVLEVVCLETPEYKYNTTSEIINVAKKQAEITIGDISDAKAGDDVPVVVTTNSDASVVIYVDGEKLKSDTIENIAAGSHTVIASVEETDLYLNAAANMTFTVGKLPADIEVSANNVTQGQATAITVSTDLDEGIVVVKLNETEVAIDLAQTKSASVVLDAPGTYEVTANYLGSDKYDSAVATAFAIEVLEKATPKVNVTIPEIKAGEDGKVNISIPNATGDVHVIVDGVDNIIPLNENGTVDFTIPEMAAGNHSVVIVYPGDETHEPKVVTKTLNVEKQATNANITAPKDAKEGDSATVKVEIANATGDVVIIVDGAEEKVPLENGIVNYPLENLSAGNHSVVVIYPGDDTHSSAYSASSFNVEAEPVVVKLATELTNITIASDLNITAYLVDENGKPISNAEIIWCIGDTVNSIMTSQDGSFTIKGVAKSKVTMDYAGNETLLATNTSITLQNVITQPKLGSYFNVTEGTTFETYAVETAAGEKGALYAFTLRDSNGNPIANATVTFAYKTVVFNSTTDENGTLHLGISTYLAQDALCAMSYVGDDRYNATFVAFNFKIMKKPTAIKAYLAKFKVKTKVKMYTVTLKTYKASSRDGKVYLNAGKVIKLKVNGKNYYATTNSKGQAVFKITNLNKKGIYTAKVVYGGSDTYQAVSKKVKLVVK